MPGSDFFMNPPTDSRKDRLRELEEFVDLYLRTYARTQRHPTHIEEATLIRMAERLTRNPELKGQYS